MGAAGAYYLLEDPLAYLTSYLDSEARADREPGQLPSAASIDGRASRLFTVPDAIDYLLTERGLTEDTITEHRIGWESDPPAFTFPIKDAHGELVNVVRRPLPHVSGPKYFGMGGRDQHNGGVELYPRPLPRGSWLLVEGLLDALLGRQEGLPAVTSTHGVTTFLDEWLPLVRGRRVAVAYDIGAEQTMHRRVAQLCAAGAEAWPVELGKVLREGKDLSDYLNGSGTAEALARFIRSERDARRRRKAA